MGAGTIGLLATLVLRLRGLDVTLFGQRSEPYRNSELLEALGARYVSTAATPIARGRAASTGRSTSSSRPPASRRWSSTACGRWRKNGVLVLSSVTGGDRKMRGPGGQDQSRVRARQQGDGRHGQREPRILRDAASRDMAHGRGAVRRLAGAAADAPGARPRELQGTDRNTDHGKGCDQGVL